MVSSRRDTRGGGRTINGFRPCRRFAWLEARNVPQVAAAWTPEGVARVLSCPDDRELASWLLSRRHQPLLVCFRRFQWFMLLPAQESAQIAIRSKKSPFFMHPPRPDDACRRFKNPGNITRENPTVKRSSCFFGAVTFEGLFHIA